MCLSIGLLDSLFIGCSIDRTKGSGYISRSPCLYHFSSSLGHIPTCNFQVEETFPSQCRLLAVVQPLKEKKKKEKPRFDGIDGQRGRKKSVTSRIHSRPIRRVTSHILSGTERASVDREFRGDPSATRYRFRGLHFSMRS